MDNSIVARLIKSLDGIYLEDGEELVVNFYLLPKVKYAHKNSIVSEAGVYFVYDEKFIYYIGQSGNFKTRFKNHCRAKVFESLPDLNISYLLESDKKQRLKIEKQNINFYSSILNNSLLQNKDEFTSNLEFVHQKKALDFISVFSNFKNLKKYRHKESLAFFSRCGAGYFILIAYLLDDMQEAEVIYISSNTNLDHGVHWQIKDIVMFIGEEKIENIRFSFIHFCKKNYVHEYLCLEIGDCLRSLKLPIMNLKLAEGSFGAFFKSPSFKRKFDPRKGLDCYIETCTNPFYQRFACLYYEE